MNLKKHFIFWTGLFTGTVLILALLWNFFLYPIVGEKELVFFFSGVGLAALLLLLIYLFFGDSIFHRLVGRRMESVETAVNTATKAISVYLHPKLPQVLH